MLTLHFTETLTSNFFARASLVIQNNMRCIMALLTLFISLNWFFHIFFSFSSSLHNEKREMLCVFYANDLFWFLQLFFCIHFASSAPRINVSWNHYIVCCTFAYDTKQKSEREYHNFTICEKNYERLNWIELVPLLYVCFACLPSLKKKNSLSFNNNGLCDESVKYGSNLLRDTCHAFNFLFLIKFLYLLFSIINRLNS